MNINKNQAKIIVEALEQCKDVNGFIDYEERLLLNEIVSYFKLKYRRSELSANLIFE